jgi:ABC-type nitrate/sulfonate/bicarbonate transport system permease component
MLRNIFFSILFIFLLLFSWQILQSRIDKERIANNETSLEAFIPTPLTIAKTFLSDGKNILKELSHTLKKAFLGLLLGVSVAILMASIFLFFPAVRNLTLPLTFAINSFPIIGFAPAIVLIFGQGSLQSIVFISALICYFPTLISIDTAFKETDKNLLEIMEVLGASKLQTLKIIHIPLAIPYLFLSLKLAIPASIIGATIGEWLGAREGIGQLITIALYRLNPGILYSSLISIALSSALIIAFLSILEYFLFPWQRKRNIKK